MVGAFEDEQSRLCEALRGTFDGDAGIRQQSEAYLDAFIRTATPLTNLVNVISNPELDVNVRASGAICMKNNIRTHWRVQSDEDPTPTHTLSCTQTHTDTHTHTHTHTEKVVLSEADKEYVRENIYELFVCVKEVENSASVACSTSRTLEECIRLVCLNDFTSTQNRWPSLLPKICLNLNQRKNTTRIYCALSALRKVMQVQEIYMQPKDSTIDVIVESTLPFVLKLASELAPVMFKSREGATLVKLALKIYSSVVHSELMNPYLFTNSLEDWLTFVQIILTTEVPADQIMDAVGSADDLPQFKAKKWAYQIIHTFLTKWGVRRLDLKEAQSAAAELFISKWANPLLVTGCIEPLLKLTKGELAMPARLHSLALEYITQCVQVSVTYKKLKEYMEPILFNVCFPLLPYTEDDELLWAEDPVEFCSTENDPHILIGDPRETAKQLISEAARVRSKDVLGPVVACVENIVKEYAAASEADKLILARKKEGALLMASCVVDRLTSKRRNLDMEPFLHMYVIPELVSSNRFLRRRALQTYAKFLVKSTPKDIKEVCEVYERYVQLTDDKELPVRLEAVQRLSAFFETEAPELQTVISQSMPRVVMQVVDVMKEVNSEDVTSTLEHILSKYEHEMAPFAEDILKFLCQRLKTMIRPDENGTESDQSVMAAYSAFRTLVSLLDIISDQKKLSEDINSHLYPIFDELLDPDQYDFLENLTDMLTYVTFYSEAIVPKHWEYFDSIYQCVCGGSTSKKQLCSLSENGWAPDHLSDFLAPLDNFISRDPHTFFSRVNENGISSKQMIVNMADKALTTDIDPNGAVELMDILFECCQVHRGVDDLLPGCLQMIWQYMRLHGKDIGKKLWGVISRCFATMFLYSPEIVLNTLHAQPIELQNSFFDVWLQNFGNVTSANGKKVMILCLTKMLDIYCKSPHMYTQVETARMPTLCVLLLDQVSALKIVRQKAANAKDDDMDSFESSESEELADDDDATNRLPQKLIEKIRESQLDDDDDLFFENENETDDRIRVSPFDSIDEFEMLQKTLSEMSGPQQNDFMQWIHGRTSATTLEDLVKELSLFLNTHKQQAST